MIGRRANSLHPLASFNFSLPPPHARACLTDATSHICSTDKLPFSALTHTLCFRNAQVVCSTRICPASRDWRGTLLRVGGRCSYGLHFLVDESLQVFHVVIEDVDCP